MDISERSHHGRNPRAAQKVQISNLKNAVPDNGWDPKINSYQVFVTLHRSSFFSQSACYRYCASPHNPNIQILASNGNEAVPFGSEANPMHHAPPYVATLCRSSTHTDLSDGGCHRKTCDSSTMPWKLWLVRGKQETGCSFKSTLIGHIEWWTLIDEHRCSLG